MAFVSTGSLPDPGAVQAALDEELHASATATNTRNRELARLLGLPDTAVADYTRQCSLRVSAHGLAVIAAEVCHDRDGDRGQQRQGPARRTVPLGPARDGPAHLLGVHG
jgi:glutaminase